MNDDQLYYAEIAQKLPSPLNLCVHTPLNPPSENINPKGMKEFRMVDLPLFTLALLTLASSTPATSPAATTILTHPANLTRWIIITFHAIIILIIAVLMLTDIITRAKGEKITLPCIVHNLGGDS